MYILHIVKNFSRISFLWALLSLKPSTLTPLVISQTLLFLDAHSTGLLCGNRGNVFFSHLQFWAWEGPSSSTRGGALPLRMRIIGHFGDWWLRPVAPQEPPSFPILLLGSVLCSWAQSACTLRFLRPCPPRLCCRCSWAFPSYVLVGLLFLLGVLGRIK